MRTHITINNIDMTPYVVAGTYKVYTEDRSESWTNGNAVKHKLTIASKVKGQFDIVCSNRGNSITLADFVAALNAATNNDVITMGVYVPTKDVFKAIQAYFEIDPKEHILAGDDSFIDVLTIKIEER